MQGSRPQHSVPTREVPARVHISRILDDAREYGCWTFIGDGDAMDAMDAMRWLGRVARVTTELHLSDADRLIVATHLLGEEAESWWDGVQAEYLMQTTWDDFLCEFRE